MTFMQEQNAMDAPVAPTVTLASLHGAIQGALAIIDMDDDDFDSFGDDAFEAPAFFQEQQQAQTQEHRPTADGEQPEVTPLPFIPAVWKQRFERRGDVLKFTSAQAAAIPFPVEVVEKQPVSAPAAAKVVPVRRRSALEQRRSSFEQRAAMQQQRVVRAGGASITKPNEISRAPQPLQRGVQRSHSGLNAAA